MLKYLTRKVAKDKQSEDITLYNFPPFLWSMRAGISISIAVIGAITFSLNTSSEPKYAACFSKECIKNIFLYYDPAFKVIAGFFALLGIIGLTFRSHQASRQIDHADRLWAHEQEKTAFDQHFKHKDLFFKKLIETEFTSYRHGNNDHDSIYQQWFPSSKITSFDITPATNKGPLSALKLMENIYENANLHIENMSFSGNELEAQLDLLCRVGETLELGYSSTEESLKVYSELLLTRLRTFTKITNGILRISKTYHYAKESSEVRIFAFYDHAVDYIKSNKEGFSSKAIHTYAFGIDPVIFDALNSPRIVSLKISCIHKGINLWLQQQRKIAS